MQRNCNVTASTKKKSGPILYTGMNQNQKNQNKTEGPEFETEVDLYVPVGAILVELEDCSETMEGSEE